ncbi:FkbM family methyltransferase [bacterium]|nr:FkbM family methyltransferase [bacterium]
MIFLPNQLFKKAASFKRYGQLFSNWWTACFARYLAKIFPNRKPVIVQFRDGRQLTFRPSSDYVALGEIFIAQNYQKLWPDSCPPLVWDIGGNIGMFVLDAFSRCPEARYVSFEPCQPTFELLDMNRRANPSIHWEVHPFGFGRATETRLAFVPKNHFGETSLFSREGRAFPLALVQLEEFWRKAGRPNVGLLKVDCEGAEFEIFESLSPEFFRAVKQILVEIHPVSGKAPESLLSLFRLQGFRIKNDLAPLYSASRDRN